MSEIFIADLGVHVNIRSGSMYEGLLWKVIDTRPYARERGTMIQHGMSSVHPHHYYFSSPRAAANLFRWKYDPNDARVRAFYERRASLLSELGLTSFESWWHHSYFDSKDHPVQTLRPPRSYEFCAKLVKNDDGMFIFDKRGLMTQGTKKADESNVVVGVEVPAFLPE